MDIEVLHLNIGDVKPDWMRERAHLDIIVPPEARVRTACTVVNVAGPLDTEGAEVLTTAGNQCISDGSQRIVLGLREVDSIGNAGVVACYRIGALMNGDPVYDLHGHDILKHMSNALELGTILHHIRLAAMQERVAARLNKVGLFEIIRHSDTVDEAIDTFN